MAKYPEKYLRQGEVAINSAVTGKYVEEVLRGQS
jgi:hypothetical protein